MSHLSPASLLVWSIILALLGTFLVFHLWSFDRFKCLRWNHSVGAFKRVMTYTYLLTVPLIAIYPIGLTAIKYSEGFVALSPYGIIPKPIDLWSPLHRRFNFPLMLCLSVGWSLEMVTHLEELCFWLFLINSGTTQQNWFHSFYFKTWVVGSILAITYMPIITALTHSDPLKSEAYTFLAGSLGSLALTVWFTPILFSFPSFLNNLRTEGVDISIIVRLTKFSEMNTIRIFFRFLFTVPLLILGIDGVRPHHHINESMFGTDLLVMIAGFGCSISSAITLVIFFPRSIEGEIAARDERKRSKSDHTDVFEASPYESHSNEFTRTNVTQHSTHTINYGTPTSKPYLLTSSPRKVQLDMDLDTDDYQSATVMRDSSHRRIGSMDKYRGDEQGATASPPPLRPNRKKGDDIELGSIDQVVKSNIVKLNAHPSNLRVNHMVHSFTSPIDLAYSSQQSGGTWLSFSRS